VRDEQPAAVGGLVHRFERQLDPAEVHARIVAQHLVVVAGDEHDAGAAVRHLEHAADDLAMRVGPVPALAQPPAVDDVADQVERLALDRAQEVHQHRGVAAARAEMDVGDPDGAVLALGTERTGVGKIEPLGMFPGRTGPGPW
jgi:hypothetical protein